MITRYQGFFYGKISALCTLTCPLAKELFLGSRTLFRNIRHVFKMLIKKVQDVDHRFLCPLPSLRSIYCYFCP